MSWEEKKNFVLAVLTEGRQCRGNAGLKHGFITNIKAFKRFYKVTISKLLKVSVIPIVQLKVT